MSAAQLGGLYRDEEIDEAITKIDAAVANCGPEISRDPRELGHTAVGVVRRFREYIVAAAKGAEMGDEDSIVLLQPGDGPAELLAALGAVLAYYEASTRVAVEAKRLQAMIGSVFAKDVQETSLVGLVERLREAVVRHVEPIVDACQVRWSTLPVHAREGGKCYIVTIA